jgi:hypothetical protein
VPDRIVTADEHAEATDVEAAAIVQLEIDSAGAERRVSRVDRRTMSLWRFLRGGLVPRRRTGRRDGDHYLPIDWHDPYLLFLALLMLLLSVTDAFMTVTLLNDGAIETNPLLAYVLNEHPQLFAVVKMGLTGFGVVVLVAVARSRLLGFISARALFQGLALAYVGLVAYEVWLVSLMA